jgi:hypothetical protein
MNNPNSRKGQAKYTLLLGTVFALSAAVAHAQPSCILPGTDGACLTATSPSSQQAESYNDRRFSKAAANVAARDGRPVATDGFVCDGDDCMAGGSGQRRAAPLSTVR